MPRPRQRNRDGRHADAGTQQFSPSPQSATKRMIAGTIVFAILVSRSDAPDGVVAPVVDLVLHAIAAGQTGA